MEIKTTDLLVKTGNPKVLDRTLNMIGAAVVGAPDYRKVDDCYIVRCFGNADFIKFAINNQGYGEVVGEYNPLEAAKGSE